MALLSNSVEIVSEIIAVTILSKFHRAVAKSPNGEMSAILIKGQFLVYFTAEAYNLALILMVAQQNLRWLHGFQLT
jgi:hypothetical protein